MTKFDFASYLDDHKKVGLNDFPLIAIEKSLALLRKRLDEQGKIFICGNGGSASDAQHFCAELTIRFRINRLPLPAIALGTNISETTACSNDFSFDQIYSRQFSALAKDSDALICLSTSGNSTNIIRAAQAAHEINVPVIALTGNQSCLLEELANVHIQVPSNVTSFIQEYHIIILHYLAAKLESSLIS